LRGTISIGRRLQDPLSELVKIDPQSIGVGLYQHDVNPSHLKESLEAVIESSVNHVGVDLNAASVPLLRHVSGFNQLVARELEDLQAGMELKGTVLNVVDFGAFVDIGLKDSGLVHISQMANRYIKSPYDVVLVGDVVTVWVLTVDQERRRVSLTMIKPGTERK